MGPWRRPSPGAPARWLAARRSAPRSTACWRLRPAERAARSSCGARPGSARPLCSSYAAERSRGRTVLRIAGVEAESDLGFAGLEGLLRPITGKLDELPQAQADALSAALGLAPSGGSDRLLVSAAALSLLAAAADDQPVLCLVDDVQFLDAASVEALLFSARRLGAEPVAMLFVGAGGSRAGGRNARDCLRSCSRASTPTPPRGSSRQALPPRRGPCASGCSRKPPGTLSLCWSCQGA